MTFILRPPAYKTIFSWSRGWSYNRGTTVFWQFYSNGNVMLLIEIRTLLVLESVFYENNVYGKVIYSKCTNFMPDFCMLESYEYLVHVLNQLFNSHDGNHGNSRFRFIYRMLNIHYWYHSHYHLDSNDSNVFPACCGNHDQHDQWMISLCVLYVHDVLSTTEYCIAS